MSEAQSRMQIEQAPPADDASIAGQAVAALQAGLGDRLVAVVLFGSRARGDARPDSDWDLLVIADGLPEKRFDRQMYLKRLLPLACLVAVSMTAHTRREFEANVPSLYLDIALDGQIVYDTRSYMYRRLATLRGIIRKRGLRRERTPHGDLWSAARHPAGLRQIGWRE